MALDMSQVQALGRQLKSSGSTLKRDTAKTVRESAKAVEDGARQRAHRVSGELQDSISSSTQGNVGQIVASSPHAIYNEYGTSKMAPIPFMTPALEAEAPNFLAHMGETAAAAIAKAIG